MKNKTKTYLVKAPLWRAKENKNYLPGDTIILSKEEAEAPGFDSLLENGFLEEISPEAENKDTE